MINHALGHLPTGATSVSLIGQPVLATALGALLIGEVPSTIKILGGLLCLVGIFIVHRFAVADTSPIKDYPRLFFALQLTRFFPVPAVLPPERHEHHRADRFTVELLPIPPPQLQVLAEA